MVIFLGGKEKHSRKYAISLEVSRNRYGNTHIPWRFISTAKEYIFP
jgi:hypothetical protein